MAKRPTSKAPDEAELGGTPDAPKSDRDTADVMGDTVETGAKAEMAPDVDAPSDIDPVTMDEPPRFSDGPDNVTPSVMEDPAPATPEPTPVRDPVPPSPPTVSSSGTGNGGGGFVGTALGGVVAAAAGYALAIFVPFPGMGVSDASSYATQADVQALTGRLAALEAQPVTDPNLAERVANLEARPAPEALPAQDLTPLAEAQAGLEQRLNALESRGFEGSSQAASADLLALVDSLRAEVVEMKEASAGANAGIEALTAQTEARLADAEAQAAALRQEAEATARRAVAAAALGRVQAAIESGAPFAGALADLPDLPVPPELASLAESGVPSRAALEDAYPPAARAALEASLRANMGEGWSDRFASFLQSTTGARSLTPREGSDPDAVLSRAEAAVKTGDLAQALTELQGLPPEGQAEMAAWTELARKRLDAVDAAASLSAAVEG
ncbi:MAG: COG4223 family protein [Paracoccaceae bacterium]